MSDQEVSPHLRHIDASYSYQTYGQWLLGKPTVSQLIKEARAQAIDLWGERPTFVIDIPTAHKSGKLPKWTHMIWANGPAQDLDMHGSHLVIIWWSEFEPDTKRVLDVVDWNKHAQDFLV